MKSPTRVITSGLGPLASLCLFCASCGLRALNVQPPSHDEIERNEEHNEDQPEGPEESPPVADSPLDPDSGVVERYHPEAYPGARLHGPDTRLQIEDCRECHGDDLRGGDSEVGCDSCHQPEWRTDCTYCHGGSVDSSGAPPRDIDHEEDPESITFRAHTSHVTQSNHQAWGCEQCHTEPTDVLSIGHVFDDSPGVAEVDFRRGLSPDAVYEQVRGCSNLYCHGNGGSATGASQDDGQAMDCSDCHPSADSGVSAWAAMSGEHSLHLQEGMVCADCHQSVVDSSQNLVLPALHVNGTIDSAFSDASIAYAGGTCSGFCHLKFHLWTPWD